MDFPIISLADRPDIISRLDDFHGAWPEFMYHDSVSSLFYDQVVTAHPEHCLIAIDGSRPVARAFSFPFHWTEDPEKTRPEGHDAVIVRGIADQLAGRCGTLVAAVEVTVRADRRGDGLSSRMLEALRAQTARLGYSGLVVPVRPNGKQEYPDVPLADYITWNRP